MVKHLRGGLCCRFDEIFDPGHSPQNRGLLLNSMYMCRGTLYSVPSTFVSLGADVTKLRQSRETSRAARAKLRIGGRWMSRFHYSMYVATSFESMDTWRCVPPAQGSRVLNVTIGLLKPETALVSDQDRTKEMFVVLILCKADVVSSIIGTIGIMDLCWPTHKMNSDKVLAREKASSCRICRNLMVLSQQ